MKIMIPGSSISEGSSTLSLSILEHKGIPSKVPSSTQSSDRLTWALHTLAFSVSLGLTVIALTLEPSSLQCTRQLSPYSPIIQDGIIKYEAKSFKNDVENLSRYRGPPSDGTEEAWKALWETPAIGVPGEKLALLDKFKPRGQGWFPAPPTDDHEGGEDFAALVEVFHQLHCINTLRLEIHKESYYNHFREWPDGSGPGNEIVKRTHLGTSAVATTLTLFEILQGVLNSLPDHCIELLRITLMCTSDVTPMVFSDDHQGFQGRTPDFSTMHTCRNFWEIRQWVEEIGLPPLS
ncbi:hypothetical protein BBP40_004330 [Aspergillus hancockii]|nr:hypothetical protein BBP40_004330 [Aspergillus hancockii]